MTTEFGISDFQIGLRRQGFDKAFGNDPQALINQIAFERVLVEAFGHSEIVNNNIQAWPHRLDLGAHQAMLDRATDLEWKDDLAVDVDLMKEAYEKHGIDENRIQDAQEVIRHELSEGKGPVLESLDGYLDRTADDRYRSHISEFGLGYLGRKPVGKSELITCAGFGLNEQMVAVMPENFFSVQTTALFSWLPKFPRN